MSDEEWSFCAPQLTLMKESAPQRDYPLGREVFNGLRWTTLAGHHWLVLAFLMLKSVLGQS